MLSFLDRYVMDYTSGCEPDEDPHAIFAGLACRSRPGILPADATRTAWDDRDRPEKDLMRFLDRTTTTERMMISVSKGFGLSASIRDPSDIEEEVVADQLESISLFYIDLDDGTTRRAYAREIKCIVVRTGALYRAGVGRRRLAQTAIFSALVVDPEDGGPCGWISWSRETGERAYEGYFDPSGDPVNFTTSVDVERFEDLIPDLESLATIAIHHATFPIIDVERLPRLEPDAIRRTDAATVRASLFDAVRL